MSERKDSGENKMAVMPMGRLIADMSLPLMVSLLVQSLYNIVDGIFVARLSEQALTATSLAYPIQLLMIAASVGTGVGVNSLISRQLGAGNHEEACRAATTGMVVSVALAAVFTVLGITCADFLAHAFSSDAETAELCSRYLGICMTFCLGIFVETLSQRLLQATGNTLLSMVSLVVGAGTNIVLDPILIFGMFGFPELGIRGAAIATVLGQWLGAAVALLLNKFRNPEIHFAVRGWRLKGAEVWKIYQVGIPTIVMQTMGSIMLASMNAILMPFSSTAVAFFGVYYKLQNFLFMPMNGLGQAAIPIIGYNYGMKDGERIHSALRILLPTAACIGLIGTAVFMLFPSQLLSLFSASAQMLQIGVPALRIFSVTFVCAALTIVIGYSLSGLGNGVVNMVGNGLRQVILFVPLAWIFARIGGISMAWYAIWVSEILAVLFCLLCLRWELNRKVRDL